ncbi:hypothetical protein ABMA28_001364 [Loxostege sticticalis]|uniref:Uncharacterized protein n=1 Tax=Loxostege sticticalis TaxID=481309 RepID=A0ABD0T1E9_LOXSC
MAYYGTLYCVYTASCYNGGADFVIPIPEVTVTIGGSVSSIPVQYEELVVPIAFEPVPYAQPNFQPNFQPSFQPNFQPSFQPNFNPSYMPQPRQLIILNDGNKDDISWLYLLLLLGNFNGNNNGGCGGCYNNCYSC